MKKILLIVIKSILKLIAIIFFIPWCIDQVYILGNSKIIVSTNFEPNDILSFYGILLGIAGVIYTIHETNKSNEENLKTELRKERNQRRYQEIIKMFDDYINWVNPNLVIEIASRYDVSGEEAKLDKQRVDNLSNRSDSILELIRRNLNEEEFNQSKMLYNSLKIIIEENKVVYDSFGRLYGKTMIRKEYREKCDRLTEIESLIEVNIKNTIRYRGEIKDINNFNKKNKDYCNSYSDDDIIAEQNEYMRQLKSNNANMYTEILEKFRIYKEELWCFYFLGNDTM